MAEIELYADDWAFMGDRYDQIVKEMTEEYGEQPTDAQIYEQIAWEYDCFMDDLKGLIDQGRRYVIFGTFGRWDGPVYGGTVIECIDDLKKFLSFNGEHYDTFKDVNGEFQIIQSHHDGCNYYTVRELNKKGMIRYNNHKRAFGGIDGDLAYSLSHTREYTVKANIPKALGWRI